MQKNPWCKSCKPYDKTENPYAYSQKDPIFYPKKCDFSPQKIRSFAYSPAEFLKLPQALQPSSPLF